MHRWPIASKVPGFPRPVVDARPALRAGKVLGSRSQTSLVSGSSLKAFLTLSVCFVLVWWQPSLRNIGDIACCLAVKNKIPFGAKQHLSCSEIFLRHAIFTPRCISPPSPNPAHTGACTSLILIKKGRAIHRSPAGSDAGAFCWCSVGCLIAQQG